MAKNFGKSPIAKRFDEVAKATMANTGVTTIKLIENSALIDYPNNGEDVSYTADLENSINELGFTDPIEVTNYKMSSGKYMIVSGHRRRVAGVKCGMDLFPCIIKSFDNENDMQNYVLLANSQRDSEKDPLLYCRRYKLHEQHLKSINFKGSIREEIAKRLGISDKQADRYNRMNRVIMPVWDLIRENTVGMSSVLPMAVLSQEEQQEIFEIFKKSIDDRIELTREKVKEIIENYKNKNLKVTHGEYIQETKDLENKKSGKNVIKSIKKLSNNLNEIYECKDREEAENLLKEFENIFKLMLDKSYFISQIYGLKEENKKIIENLAKKINNNK